MEIVKPVSNKPVPDDIAKRLDDVFKKDKPHLVIIGDLSLTGLYGSSALAVSLTKLAIFDSAHENGVLEMEISDFVSAESKRLYGNIIFYCFVKTGDEQAVIGRQEKDKAAKKEKGTQNENKTPVFKNRHGKRVEVFRTTYASANVCDAVADYINAVSGYHPVTNTIGNPPKDNIEQMRTAYAVFNKSRDFCSKCGRKLSSSDVNCLKCADKKRVISKLWSYLRPKRYLLLAALALSAFTTGLSLVPTYINAILIDNVIPNRDKTGLMIIVASLALIFLVQRTVGSAQGYLFRVVANRFTGMMKKDVFAKAQYLGMNFYDKTTTGSVMNRISNDVHNIQNFVMNLAREAIIQFLTMAGIIGVMFFMDWKLTLLSLTPVPVLAMLSRKYGRKIRPIYHRKWKRGAAMTGVLTDSIPGIRIIKTFSGEERAIDKYGRHVDDYWQVDLEIAKIAAVYPTIIGFLVSLGSLAIWFIGGVWVIEGGGALTLGRLMAFIGYTGMFYGPVHFFLGLNDSYNNTLVSLEKVMEIFDAEQEANYGKGSVLPAVKGKIEFRNVNFSFDRSKKVLNSANFIIEPGDVVGIVGTTGAGKSTVLHLLMRFYDDYEGEILIDNVNIKDIDLEYLRSQIGYVQQEPLMFCDTVFNNICYADPAAGVEQVIAAAEVANAHEFISKLSDGYDTLLGERGVGLSGGEKQRVSVARAVLRNPAILMFDEATSSVDSETEKLIQEAIEQMISGRTTLMIAHRLSTLRKANKIIVVDNGNITEFGTPEELMELKGKYYKLIRIQTMTEEIAKIKSEERFEE